MSEYGWLHWNYTYDMIDILMKGSSPRKRRLLACGYVRQFWEHVRDDDLRSAVEVAEDFADFRRNKQSLKASRSAITFRIDDMRTQIIASSLQNRNSLPDWIRDDSDFQWWQTQIEFEFPFAKSARRIEPVLQPGDLDSSALRDVSCQFDEFLRTDTNEPFLGSYLNPIFCNLIREVFGNPFRPVVFNSSWCTSTVLALASQMYESRDFAPMPILADALQDAGCENADILAHCRGEGPHVRGCWVVDLVLGKA